MPSQATTLGPEYSIYDDFPDDIDQVGPSCDMLAATPSQFYVLCHNRDSNPKPFESIQVKHCRWR